MKIALMKITDGGSQGIGSIGRDLSRQVEQRSDHFLHLLFSGLTVTHNGQFDLGGAVFVDRNALFCRSQQCHATGLSQLECALRIARKKNLF